MDQNLRIENGNSIAVTGYGWEASASIKEYLLNGKNDAVNLIPAHDCRPVEYLKVRKTLKFMAKQDRLAVSAAGQAINMASLQSNVLEERTGVFMSVGYIPFSLDDADIIARNSQKDNSFSMDVFSTTGFENVNPLLTFACLPNMPAHHISANFNIKDEYYVTYPETPEMYSAMQEAIIALNERRIDVALVGGVADQDNFLVKNHYAKIRSDKDVLLPDSAAFIVLERRDDVEPKKNMFAFINEFCIYELDMKSKSSYDVIIGAPELIMSIITGVENKTNDIHEHCSDAFKYSCRWEIV